MTSLMPQSSTSRQTRSVAQLRHDLGHRRPLVVVAALGGVLAAGATLVVCLALGVIGWYLADAGAHGTSTDGLRAGALGWLMAHGSGLSVLGARVGVVPLGLTAVCAWSVWRVGLRVGDSVSGHGPDADALGDGQRDWTVPTATGFLVLGYTLTGVLVAALAGSDQTAPDTSRVVAWSVLMVALVGGPAIAVGSGRAAIWLALMPVSVRAVAAHARTTVTTFLVVATIVLLGALVADFSTAVNVMSQLHTGAGGGVSYTALTAAVLPNASAFSGSYLLGPGFAVGTATLVSPTTVALGPLPMFPLLAALPDAGPTPGWTAALIAVGPLVGVWAAVRAHRRFPTLAWDRGALHGVAGGVLAGVTFGVLARISGGAAGPGRMQHVAPFAFDVTLHAITAFGLGGLVGGLLATWWTRRHSEPVPDAA